MEHTHNHHNTASKMKGHAGALEAWLVPFFKDVPHIPMGGKKFITMIAPWLSLVFGVLGLVGLLGGGALGVLLSPFAAMGKGSYGIAFLITVILGIITAILSILSFAPLKDMKKLGWDYAFYAFIIGTISTLVTIVLTFNGIGGLIGTAIGAYILFEVREMYH